MKIAGCVEYDGSRFYGWQYQDSVVTVQGAVEFALSAVANHPVTVHCAGRTDTGVHACAQIFHFSSHSERSDYSWAMGTNKKLPDGVSLMWTRKVDETFHARFSALARRYRYVILNRRIRPAYLHHKVCWHPLPLDARKMSDAAAVLSGQHDFSAFRSSQCTNKQPVKTIEILTVKRKLEWIWIDVEADGFLHHMVRNIVGSLIAIGSGKYDANWLDDVLKSKDRKKAGATAPAHGLYFVSAAYPQEFLLPELPQPCRYW